MRDIWLWNGMVWYGMGRVQHWCALFVTALRLSKTQAMVVCGRYAWHYTDLSSDWPSLVVSISNRFRLA